MSIKRRKQKNTNVEKQSIINSIGKKIRVFGNFPTDFTRSIIQELESCIRTQLVEEEDLTFFNITKFFPFSSYVLPAGAYEVRDKIMTLDAIHQSTLWVNFNFDDIRLKAKLSAQCLFNNTLTIRFIEIYFFDSITRHLNQRRL